MGEGQRPSEALGWHADTNAKVTLVVALTDPSRYEGGHLDVQSGMCGFESYKLAKGSAAIYSEGTYHRVTSVARGVREMAVFEWWLRDEARVLCF